MVEESLLDRLLTVETDRVEWKESARDTADIYHAVCALANDLSATGEPGFLVVGVDRQGRVVGGAGDGTAVDAAQRELADLLRSTKLLPTPSVDISPAVRDGRSIIVVQVGPYPVPPVVQVNGVAWVRVGSTTRRATEADHARLRERRPEHLLPFDSRPAAGTGAGDLECTGLRGEYEAAKETNGAPETFPSFESWLTQRELGKVVRGTWTPNHAAILVYGQNPQGFVPGAYIEFVRYRGVDVSGALVSRRTITGTLPDQLDSAWSLLSANIGDVPAAPEGIRQGYVPEYPLEALKELARNMVQHRQLDATHAPGRIEWFDDRIEFSNPGHPFGRASEGEFGEHSDYRNPGVTRLLAQLGYVERLGRGIRLVRSLLERNGNPPIEVQTDGFTRVTVTRRP